MTLKERRENLLKQQELLKEQFIKVAGALELVESMIDDEENNDGKKQNKK